jgi:hypothetical protein
MNDYKQTELEIEIAKKNLEEVCKRYDVPCKVILGTPLYTIIQDVPMCSWTEDCWPEVVACNIPEDEVKAYLQSQKLTNYYLLTQNERIKNDYKY